MNATKDILQGKWHQVKGRVRQQWSKLTDDDFAVLSGKPEELTAMLQKRYGYGKVQAEMEIATFVNDFDNKYNTHADGPAKV